MSPIDKLRQFFSAKTVTGTSKGDAKGARPLLAAVICAVVLTGAVAPTAAQAGDLPAGRHETYGTLGGAVAGGVAGNQFGKGKGKWATTAIGAVVGGIIGNNIGSRFDGNDFDAINQAGAMAVELPLRKKVEWFNDKSGRGGYVTTTAHWLTPEGNYFREIRVHFDRASSADFTAYAFKSPVDGAWRMAQPQGGEVQNGNSTRGYTGRVQGRIR